MKQLEHLHRQLAQLCRLRQQVRWAAGASSIAMAVLTALAVIFILDWTFQRNEDLLQRLFLMVLGLGAIAWAVRRFAMPLLDKREDKTEMALLVQRRAGIDSDVVAAMQFESSEAATWGSPQMTTAVIEQVSRRQTTLNVMGSVPYHLLMRRAVWLIVPLVFWVAAVAAYPAHVGVFLSRLMFGSQHYPSLTQIVAVTVNGKTVKLTSPDAAVRIPYGQPLKFDVKATGPLAVTGRVEMTGAGRGQAATVTLDAAAEKAEDGSFHAKGDYPRLVQSFHYQVWLGDAYTETLQLDVVPLPVVDVEPEVIAPDYARAEKDEVQNLPRGTRQFSVLEGSQVRLKIRADRAMKKVALKANDQEVALERVAGAAVDGETWISKVDGSPLASVEQAMRFSIEACDPDDAALEQPIEGTIRIEPDLPPKVVAAIRTPFVVVDGEPTIQWGASDDHALARVWFTWEIVHGERPASATSELDAENAEFGTAPDAAPAVKPVIPTATAEPEKPSEVDVYRLAKDQSPVSKRTGDREFRLSELKLFKGDTVRVTFHATDYRGSRPGKTSDSAPVEFHVTDSEGVLAGMSPLDTKSDLEIQKMIRSQIGISTGGSQ